MGFEIRPARSAAGRAGSLFYFVFILVLVLSFLFSGPMTAKGEKKKKSGDGCAVSALLLLHFIYFQQC